MICTDLPPVIYFVFRMFQILFVAGLSFSSPKFSRAGGPFRWLREFKILQVVQRQENSYSGNEISQFGYKMHFTLIFTLFQANCPELSTTLAILKMNACCLPSQYIFKQARHSQRLRQ